MVSEGHRLPTLEMRVAGHQRVGLGLGEGERDERERIDLLARLRTGVGDVSRNAAATWSLRDRPAWIFGPSGPSSRSIDE